MFGVLRVQLPAGFDIGGTEIGFIHFSCIRSSRACSEQRLAYFPAVSSSKSSASFALHVAAAGHTRTLKIHRRNVRGRFFPDSKVVVPISQTSFTVANLSNPPPPAERPTDRQIVNQFLERRLSSEDLRQPLQAPAADSGDAAFKNSDAALTKRIAFRRAMRDVRDGLREPLPWSEFFCGLTHLKAVSIAILATASVFVVPACMTSFVFPARSYFQMRLFTFWRWAAFPNSEYFLNRIPAPPEKIFLLCLMYISVWGPVFHAVAAAFLLTSVLYRMLKLTVPVYDRILQSRPEKFLQDVDEMENPSPTIHSYGVFGEPLDNPARRAAGRDEAADDSNPNSNSNVSRGSERSLFLPDALDEMDIYTTTVSQKALRLAMSESERQLYFVLQVLVRRLGRFLLAVPMFVVTWRLSALSSPLTPLTELLSLLVSSFALHISNHIQERWTSWDSNPAPAQRRLFAVFSTLYLTFAVIQVLRLLPLLPLSFHSALYLSSSHSFNTYLQRTTPYHLPCTSSFCLLASSDSTPRRLLLLLLSFLTSGLASLLM